MSYEYYTPFSWANSCKQIKVMNISTLVLVLFLQVLAKNVT